MNHENKVNPGEEIKRGMSECNADFTPAPPPLVCGTGSAFEPGPVNDLAIAASAAAESVKKFNKEYTGTIPEVAKQLADEMPTIAPGVYPQYDEFIRIHAERGVQCIIWDFDTPGAQKTLVLLPSNNTLEVTPNNLIKFIPLTRSQRKALKAYDKERLANFKNKLQDEK